jgi:hypothetical protein
MDEVKKRSPQQFVGYSVENQIISLQWGHDFSAVETHNFSAWN